MEAVELNEFANDFIKEIISHFIEKVHHKFLISADIIRLQLYCEEEWESIDFRALHSICKETTNNFINQLELLNFDKKFLISSTPEKGKVTVCWFKEEAI